MAILTGRLVYMLLGHSYFNFCRSCLIELEEETVEHYLCHCIALLEEMAVVAEQATSTLSGGDL